MGRRKLKTYINYQKKGKIKMITKTINFNMMDVASINHILGDRGDLYVNVHLELEESDDGSVECDGIYFMKWFSFNLQIKPYSISTDLKDELLELFLNSEFDEGEAFALNEDFLYDLSCFEKYRIPYIVSIVV